MFNFEFSLPENIFAVFFYPPEDTIYRQNGRDKNTLLITEKLAKDEQLFIIKWLMKPLSVIYILWFTYCGLRDAFHKTDLKVVHSGFTDADFTLDTQQPKFIIIIHGIAGAIFLLLSILQVEIAGFLLQARMTSLHHSIGGVSVFAGIIHAIMAFILSWRALDQTYLFYQMAAIVQFICALMLVWRAKQGWYQSHRRFSIAFQQSGLMFLYTRLFIALFDWADYPSYFLAVAFAGLTAFLMFYLRVARYQTAHKQIKPNLMIETERPVTGWEYGRAFYFTLILFTYVVSFYLKYAHSVLFEHEELLFKQRYPSLGFDTSSIYIHRAIGDMPYLFGIASIVAFLIYSPTLYFALTPGKNAPLMVRKSKSKTE